MKRFAIPSKILLAVFILSSLITLTYDLLQFYSSLSIRVWDFIQEGLSLFNVVLLYLYFNRRSFAGESDVSKNVKNFSILLISLYLFALALQQLLKPTYSLTAFPQSPDTVEALIYSNLISLAGELFLVPMLLIIRNLINYKKKKRTALYTIVALAGSTVAIVLAVIFQIPLNLNFNANNGLSTILANSAFLTALLFLFILSTRNSWITYLKRRQKFYFFFSSIPLSWLVIYIFDFAFQQAVPTHSIALAAFINIAWLFLVFYTLLAGLNLLLHLPTARVFDRKMKELASLQNLSRAISVELNSPKLIQLVADMSAEVLESAGTWIELHPDDPSKRQLIIAKNFTILNLSQVKYHFTAISEQVVHSKKALVVNDLSANKNLPGNPVQLTSIQSFAAIPIVSANGQLYGILYAVKSQAFGFNPDDVNLLEAYANQASIAIENSELLKSSLERERMERELQIAREVQMRLLPQQTPTSAYADFETLTITAYEVGGDYYDFYRTPNGDQGIIIGDVSGKGTSAAFYMAETKGIFQSLSYNYNSPKDILVQSNVILYKSLEKKSFISLLAGQININSRSRVFRFARAGHCPVIYFNSKEHRSVILQPAGIAVGLDKGPLFNKILEELEIPLAPGDIIALYTDGLSEARNKTGEEFGEERLQQVLDKYAELSAPQIKEKIIDEILQFLDGQNLHDDLTLILIKIKK